VSTEGAQVLLTISQLASFAGVTVRAVRHYHARGLLPEPERDASGYRRYDARAAVQLIRIKTLAEAGVPLARVGELLDADRDRFERALAEVDRTLEERVELLQGHRRRVARLATGAELALPDEVVAYLARLRELGISERVVEIEHDGWIMLAAYAPERVAEWIAPKYEALNDTTFSDLYRRLGEAFEWSPDDSRLEALADAIVDYMRRSLATRGLDFSSPPEFDGTFVDLLDAHTVRASPAWNHMQTLIEKRGGLTGWTDIQEA
jgi:DNA-binding transcriptional MerR regulator